MAIDPQFPQVGADLVTESRKPTQWWYDFLRGVNTKLFAADAKAQSAVDAVANIPAQVQPDIQGQHPIVVYGDDLHPLITLDPAFAASVGRMGPPGMDGRDGEDAWIIPGPKGDKGEPGASASGSGGQTIFLHEEHHHDGWPIPGPTGTTGAAGGGGGGALTYLGAITLSAATSGSLTSLDLGAYKAWFVTYAIKNVSGSTCSARLYYNNDTTNTNYSNQLSTANGATVNAARTNDATFTAMLASEQSTGKIWIEKQNNLKPVACVDTSRDLATTNSPLLQKTEHSWNNAANVTRVDVTSTVASSLTGVVYFWGLT